MTPRELAEHECKPLALAWINAALEALARRDDELTVAALETNFRIPRNEKQEKHDPVVSKIVGHFLLSRAVITESAHYFREISEADATALFRGGNVPPAYAIFGDRIFFTPRFEAFGPLCRTAMVVHESMHIIDPRGGEPANHISEFDEPRFSSQTIEQSFHNASSYASFSAQVHERALAWPQEARFGAGNPNR